MADSEERSVTAREAEAVLHLREVKGRSFAEIALGFEISEQEANQLYQDACRIRDWVKQSQKSGFTAVVKKP